MIVPLVPVIDGAPIDLPDEGNEIAEEHYWLPRTVVEAIAGPDLERLERSDGERIDGLRESLRCTGWTKPLPLVIKDAQVCIHDGRHRLLAARHLGLDSVPVRFIEGDGQIRIHSLPVLQVLQPALLAGNEVQSLRSGVTIALQILKVLGAGWDVDDAIVVLEATMRGDDVVHVLLNNLD